MAAPEGYTELGRIGFADQGNYAAGTTYRTGDVVYYNGSTWSALKDNLKGVTPENGANWKYMARGFADEKLEAVKATDTSGVLGTAGAEVVSQALIDAIADKVMTKLLAKANIVNNGLTTDEGYAADARQLNPNIANTLAWQVAKTNSDLDEKLSYTQSNAAVAMETNVDQSGNAHLKVSKGSLQTLLKFGPDQRVTVEKYDGSKWSSSGELLGNADIQKGRVATLSCPSNAITEHKLVFPKAFTVAPRVMLTLNSSTESPKYGSALPFTTNITSTGCTIRVANNSDTTFSPNIEWIAIAL